MAGSQEISAKRESAVSFFVVWWLVSDQSQSVYSRSGQDDGVDGVELNCLYKMVGNEVAQVIFAACIKNQVTPESLLHGLSQSMLEMD